MSRRADTPVAVTRRAASRTPAPLPVVETKQSHAYGAKGKANLDRQTTTSTSAIDDAFATTNDSMAMPPPSRPATKRRQTKISSVKQVSPIESLEEEAEIVTNGTATEAATETARPRTGVHGIQYVTDDPIPLPEPNKFLVFIATASKFIETRSFWVLIFLSWIAFVGYLALFATTICVNTNQTATVNTTIEHVCYHAARMIGVNTHLLPRHAVELQVGLNNYLYYNHKDLSGKFVTLSDNVAALDTSQHELSAQVGLLDESISEIKSILPSMMVVLEKEGRMVIPEPFWEALTDKMRSGNSSALWEGFLEANRAKLQNFMSDEVKVMVDGVLATQKIVTSSQLESSLIDNNRMMEEQFNGTLRHFQAMMLQEMETTAQKAAKDVFESSHLAKGQIGALAYSVMIVNMNERMRQTNYFSPGLGAFVEPHHTSPTWRQPTFAQEMGRWMWWGIGAVFRNVQSRLAVHPPTTALSEWSENGDCWCADSPETATTKLQIGVRMPFMVYPRALIIEHIPSSGTRDIAAAPQNFEVWAKMSSGEEASRVTQSLEALPGRFWPGQCGDPPSDDGLWVCSARGTYDIHGPNYLQHSEFPPEPWKYGLKTSSVVLKVTSNWGGDHTCLYRIRLTGDEVGSMEKELGG